MKYKIIASTIILILVVVVAALKFSGSSGDASGETPVTEMQ